MANPVRIEQLESRTLLTAVLVQAIGNQVFPQDSGPEQADMSGVFTDNNGTSDLTYSATSSNPAVLVASVSGSLLTITPVTGESGFARVQMAATDPEGDRVSNTFRVQITASTQRTLDVTIGAGGVPSLHFAESDGAGATLSLGGPGSAVLDFGGDNLSESGGVLHGANQELESITLNNTTAATSLTITGQKAAGNVATIGTITASGSIGHLRIANANLQGDLTVSGTLPDLDVDFAEGGTLSIGSGAVSIRGISFVDENFTSTSPITGVKMIQWTNSDNVPESFSAAFVKSISVRGNFTPGLQLSGVGAKGRTLGSAKIPGAIGGTWNITGASAPLAVGSTATDWNATFGALPSLSVRGTMNGNLTAPKLRFLDVRGSMIGSVVTLTATGTMDLQSMNAGLMSFGSVLAAGSIGTITTHAMLFSDAFAGVEPSSSFPPLPSAPSDFISTASIGSVIIHPTGKFNGFVSSRIAATAVGRLQLGTTQTSNGGTVFGVAAGRVALLVADDLSAHQRINLKNVSDADALAEQIAAEKLNLADFAIRIL